MRDGEIGLFYFPAKRPEPISQKFVWEVRHLRGGAFAGSCVGAVNGRKGLLQFFYCIKLLKSPQIFWAPSGAHFPIRLKHSASQDENTDQETRGQEESDPT